MGIVLVGFAIQAVRHAKTTRSSLPLTWGTRTRTNFTARRVDMRIARTVKRSSVHVMKRSTLVMRPAGVVSREVSFAAVCTRLAAYARDRAVKRSISALHVHHVVAPLALLRHDDANGLLAGTDAVSRQVQRVGFSGAKTQTSPKSFIGVAVSTPMPSALSFCAITSSLTSYFPLRAGVRRRSASSPSHSVSPVTSDMEVRFDGTSRESGAVRH